MCSYFFSIIILIIVNFSDSILDPHRNLLLNQTQHSFFFHPSIQVTQPNPKILSKYVIHLTYPSNPCSFHFLTEGDESSTVHTAQLQKLHDKQRELEEQIYKLTVDLEQTHAADRCKAQELETIRKNSKEMEETVDKVRICVDLFQGRGGWVSFISNCNKLVACISLTGLF